MKNICSFFLTMVRANVTVVKLKMRLTLRVQQWCDGCFAWQNSHRTIAALARRLLGHLFHNTLHTRSLSSSLRLLNGKGHDSFELLTVLSNQTRNDSVYIIIA